MKTRLLFSLSVLICCSLPLLFAEHVVVAQQVTPTTPSPQPSATAAPTATPSLEERIGQVENQVSDLKEKPKDAWDKINSVSGLVSGGLVAVIGILATYVYNERQRSNSEDQKQRELKILRVQTVQSFMPQLQSDDPKAVELALLAITALDDTKLATDLAALLKTRGAISALEKIANSPNQETASLAKKSLSSLFETLRNCVVEIHGSKGLVGSGFFVSTDGHIITADFVVNMIDNKDKIHVIINHKSYNAKIVLIKPATKLALLKVDNGQFPNLQIVDNPKADYQEDIFLLGPKPDLGGWITTTGKITAKDIKDEEINLIGTDAQIAPGYAGAPAVNQYGQVVGMAFATHIDRQRGANTSLLMPASYILQLLNEQSAEK